jgi:hypothetical protein
MVLTKVGRERDVLIRFAPSASLRSPNQFPSQGRGRVLISHVKITITHIGALNYVEFRAAMNLTWFMAEREAYYASFEALSTKGFVSVILLSPIQS